MPHRLNRRALLRCAQGLFALTAVCTASAQNSSDFAVTPAQMQSLGVRLLKLEQPAAIGGQAFPARVVLPPSQEYVLSAPVAGVVDQLLVSRERQRPGRPTPAAAGEPGAGRTATQTERGGLQTGSLRPRSSASSCCSPKASFPQRRVQEAESAAAEEQARQRHAEAALRLAGMDAAAIKRVAEGGAMQDALVLRARAPGIVVKLAAKPGMRAQGADALVRIADTRKLWLDIQVPVDRQAQIATKGLLRSPGSIGK
jgi:cobalt-zinc-cadmium efflux system membrane fusion protein